MNADKIWVCKARTVQLFLGRYTRVETALRPGLPRVDHARDVRFFIPLVEAAHAVANDAVMTAVARMLRRKPADLGEGPWTEEQLLDPIRKGIWIRMCHYDT